MSETREDIAPQSREIYRLLYGRGKFVPPTIQTSIDFATLQSQIFVSLHPITLKLGSSSDFKALFPMVSIDFR